MPDLCFDLLERNRLVSTFSTYVLTVLNLCFDCARPIYRLCSTHVSTALHLWFDCARPIFWISRPKYRMVRLYAWKKFRNFRPKSVRFWLSEPMFWLSPPKLGMFRLSWPMFWLSRPKSGMFYFCARPMFRLSWPKLGMFRLSRPMFWLCSIYALTVLDLCFDCARPMFRLRSTYILTFPAKIGYVSTFRPIFWLSRPKSGRFWFYAWPIFQLSRLKLGLIRLFPQKFWLYRLCSTYVSTVLGLCFDCARPMFRLRSTEIVCLDFVDPCFDRNWVCFVFVLDLCFDFLDRNWVVSVSSTFILAVLNLYFDCARPMFRLCSTYVSTVLEPIFRLWRPERSLFWLVDLCFDCARPKLFVSTLSTYVSTFSTKIEYVLILCSTYVSSFSTESGSVSTFSTYVLNLPTKLYLGFIPRYMFRLSRSKLGMFRLSRPTFWLVDLCFDFCDQNWVCFEFLDLFFDSARPIFRLCSIYVSTLMTSTVLDLYIDFLDRNWVYFDFLNLCFELLDRNMVEFEFVVDLCFVVLDRNWVCFDFLDLCFDFLDQNRVCFDFELDL